MHGSRMRRFMALGSGMLMVATVGLVGPAGVAAQDEEPVKIGYISLGDADPFVLLVTQGIRAAADEAGVELSECDAAFLDDLALSCARTLAAVGNQAMINWQLNPAISPQVCEAYGDLPTVAIDIPEEPCQATFVGANNREAGLVAGTGLGEFAQERFDCEYDAYITLDFPVIPEIDGPRSGGTREGFEAICGVIPDEKYFSLDTFAGGPDQAENSRRQVADTLTILPDAKTIFIVAPAGDSMPIAALGAADTAGRKDQVWIVGHGADPTVQDLIRNEPQWVGDVAYFPERYGDLIMPLAVALAKGETVPEEVLVTHEFITADNIDEYYPAE